MDTVSQPFRYTRNNNILTLNQRLFYEKNGYLVFPRLIQDVLDKCHQRFDDIVAGKVPRDGMVVMYDVKDKKSVNKVQDIHHDKVFREYIEHKSILDIVEAFTGPNIIAINTMMIAKPPDKGFGTSKHPPHQDLYYFPYRPVDSIVAAWTAMETCTRENGCLYVAAGTHAFNRLHKHDYPPGSEPGSVNKYFHTVLDLPVTLDWVYLEMEPGDTVFFHPLLIHGSGVNKTNKSRRSICSHYMAAECQYVGMDNEVQNKIEKEILEYTRKRYPDIKITYYDVWNIKSKLVRGIRSSL